MEFLAGAMGNGKLALGSIWNGQTLLPGAGKFQPHTDY